MKNIITDFKNFIELSSVNLWSYEDGLEENFKLYVDTPTNHLDIYLNNDYQGTPLWFYFLSFDYSLFDYFKERISLKTDWDYTLLFNIDYIESSTHLRSLSHLISHEKLTPFCPFEVLLDMIKKEDFLHSSYQFSFPLESLKKLSRNFSSDFFNHAKIKFQLASFSHILQHDFNIGIEILHSLMHNDLLRNTFLSQLSHTKNEDFFNVKINLFFLYPQYCPESFVEKIDSQQLTLFVTEIISQKKIVDKKNLFKIMNKEHLILAIHTQYFSMEELSQFITDKQIHYHLLDHRLSNGLHIKINSNKIGLTSKKHKI